MKVDRIFKVWSWLCPTVIARYRDNCIIFFVGRLFIMAFNYMKILEKIAGHTDRQVVDLTGQSVADNRPPEQGGWTQLQVSRVREVVTRGKRDRAGIIALIYNVVQDLRTRVLALQSAPIGKERAITVCRTDYTLAIRCAQVNALK